MLANGVEVPLLTYQKYEGGFRSHGRFAAKAFEQFLDDNPTIANPPVVGRWKNQLPDAKVTEIRKLRENGAALLTIAERFGISESSVSLNLRRESTGAHFLTKNSHSGNLSLDLRLSWNGFAPGTFG
jgi:hypothetical protein